jgi:hypothetical protein
MHPSSQKSKKTISFFLMPILMLMLLMGCGSDTGNSTQTPPYVTWTFSPSATPTCAPNIQLSTPEGWGSYTRLIVILFDPRSIEDQELEFINGNRTKDIPSFIVKTAPALIRSGDQFAIFQLGYSVYEAARVSRLYSYVSVPVIYNTPFPRATLTPLPPTKIPTPGYEAVATANYVLIQSTARANAEAENKAIYNCEVKYWNENIMLTATAWGATATAEISQISEKIASDFEYFSKNNTTLERPYRNEELDYGGVYFGLNFATTIFQSYCNRYTNCVLLIIDDLHVWRKHNPDNLPINLTGVKIYTIMPNCKDIDQPSCTDLQGYWNDDFKGFGATDEPIYWNGVRAEFNLLREIGR